MLHAVDAERLFVWGMPGLQGRCAPFHAFDAGIWKAIAAELVCPDIFPPATWVRARQPLLREDHAATVLRKPLKGSVVVKRRLMPDSSEMLSDADGNTKRKCLVRCVQLLSWQGHAVPRFRSMRCKPALSCTHTGDRTSKSST